MNNLNTVLNVSGMRCPSCVRHVTSALGAVPFVSTIDVQLEAGTVNVRHEPGASIPMLIQALQEAGYEAEVRGAAAQAP